MPKRYVEFDDISDDELMDEIISRAMFNKNLQLGKLLAVLAQIGCPAELLDPIREWNKEPILTDIDLRNWKEACAKR